MPGTEPHEERSQLNPATLSPPQSMCGDRNQVRSSSDHLRRIGEDLLRYTPATLIPALLTLVSAVVFTRLFSPADYGAYSLALAVVIPVTTLLTEWIGQPAARFYAEYVSAGRLPAYKAAVGFAAACIAAVIAVASLILIAIHVAVPSIPTDSPVFLACALLLLTQAVTSCITPILPVSFKSTAYLVITLGTSFLSVAFSLSLVLADAPHAYYLLLGNALANIVMLPFVVWRAGLSLSDFFTPPDLDVAATLRTFARYGAPMAVWFVASTVLNSEDRYVIEWFRGAKEVGIYSVNYSLAFGIGSLLIGPVVMASTPVLYQTWSVLSVSHAQRVTTQLTRIFVVAGLFMVGYLFLIASPVQRLVVGAPFLPGVGVIIPVLVGRFFWGMCVFGHKSLEMSNNTVAIAGSGVIVALVNLALNVAIVPRYGYIAAAYTTMICYALYAWIIKLQTRSWVEWKIGLIWSTPFLAIAVAGTVATRIVLDLTEGLNPLGDILMASVVYIPTCSIGVWLFARSQVLEFVRGLAR